LKANIVNNQDFVSTKKKLLNCRGRLLSLDHPLVMGILNVTTDSFYDGGRFFTEKKWLLRTEQMLEEGADIIDIGCTSTKPGAKISDKETESDQLTKVLDSVLKRFPEIIISADTYRASVAKEAVEAGASIINDISGGTIDTDMFETLAHLKVPYILMHIKGIPENMHIHPSYSNIVKDIVAFFSEMTSQLHSIGLSDIIIDPGFGFGKNIEHNYTLLKHLHVFNYFNCPLMVGVSRKSMIWKYLKVNPEEALNGSTVLHTISLLAGADILRVHDVKEAKECIKIVEAVRGNVIHCR
jgi:dihydropteroate synthase